MTAMLNTRAQLLAFRAINLAREHAYLLAVALLAGMLLSFILPDTALAKCKPEGVPARAGDGVPGLLDSRSSTMDGDSLYGDYGYAGLEWHACDLGGPIAGNEWAGDPDAMMDTKIGTAALGLAKWLAAAATGMHSWNTNTTEVLAPMDDMITKLSDLTRSLVVDEWMIMFILLAGVMLFAWSVTKEVRKTMMTFFAFFASVGFLAIVGTYPLTVAHGIDDVGSKVTSTADQKALEVGGIDAKPEEALGAIMNDRILYPLWAKGALGKDDQTDSTADTWAKKLYKAQATTYDESDVDPDDKKDEYEDIYKDLGKSEDPGLQQTMKGQSYNRSGIGLAALIQSALVSIVRIASEALIFASKLIFRFVPIIGPVFAVLAVWHVTRPVAKEGLNMVGAAAINVLVFGVLAALHTALIAFLSNNLNFGPMMFVSALVTFVFWKFTKPFRSLTEMVSPSSVKQSMSASSKLNPMTAVMGAWALLNTGRSNKDDQAPRSPQNTQADQEFPDSTGSEPQGTTERSHTTNNGPLYGGVPEPSPVPVSRNTPGVEVEPPQSTVQTPQVQHPEMVPDDDARDTGVDSRRDPEAIGAEPQPTAAIDQADTAAANQRRDDHGERVMGDRIVSAIDRAAANQNQPQPAAPRLDPGEGQVMRGDQETPADIVRMSQDPQSGVYFNPHIDAQTSTRFNQHIFIPGSDTFYERTDQDSERISRETMENN